VAEVFGILVVLHLGAQMLAQPWNREGAEGEQGDGHHQSRPEGGAAAHPQSRGVGVGGRERADLDRRALEAEALAGRREEQALSAKLVGADGPLPGVARPFGRRGALAANTGCRDQEFCNPRWEWEVAVPELGTSVFIIPGSRVKNGDERLVVLNSVVASRRGRHPEYVFTYGGNPITKMLTSAWKKARRANLPQVRVHDLKHTFGRRLRAAGVSYEDRQDLLGHRSGRITTHYSAAEQSHLLEAAECH
jgi:hypothetical protein